MELQLTQRFSRDIHSGIGLDGFYLLVTSQELPDTEVEVTEELLSSEGISSNFNELIPVLTVYKGNLAEISFNTTDITHESADNLYLLYKVPFIGDRSFIVNKIRLPYSKLRKYKDTQIVFKLNNMPNLSTLWNRLDTSGLSDWSKLRFKLNHPEQYNKDELYVNKTII